MKLTILETSDMHGYVFPTNFAGEDNLAIGVAKVSSKLKELKKQASGPVLMVENGDFLQGSPLSYYIAKKPQHTASELTKVINQLKYDVQVLGNHEFNYGLAYLKEALSSYQAPVLAANILNEKGEPFFGKAYTIVEKEGVKIAVLGLVTQYIPNWEQPATIKGMVFESIIKTAQRYMPILKAEADIVVVSYHGGFERDLETGEPTEALTGENEGYRLLQEVPGIDALLTGHQHREIATKINGVPVVQPGSRGNLIGVIELELTKTNTGLQVIDSSARLEPLTDVNADSEIIALMQPIEDELEKWLDQPVGKASGDMRILDPMGARLQEHPYIEFINRVQMAASGAKISGTSLFNNEGKGFNEIISMRDVITNYIYPNTLAVLSVTGAELKAALEQTADYLAVANGEIIFNPKYVKPKPQYYNYDMYEGVDYVIDMNKPSGQRITHYQFEGHDILPEEELEIVVNQYRAVGGGNYHMFHADKIIREIPIDMTELIAEYLKEHPVIEAKVNHNFSVIL